MDVKELITFRTIIEEGSFSKAAAKLNYAQSTVTNQVQRLEKELGFKLFKRGWDAVLTEAGSVYANEVEGLINHWNYVRDQAKSLEKEEIGTLDIGVIEAVADRVLPAVLQRFREQKPLIQCRFLVGNTDTLSNALAKQSLDLAICGEPHSRPSFHFEPVNQEHITFIVGKNHPFANRQELALGDLFEYPLFVGGENCLYHLQLAKELSSFPNMPFSHTVSQLSAIPSFILAIPAVGAVLSSTPLPPETIPIPIPLAQPSIPIGILQNLHQMEYVSTTKRLFIQLVKEELSRNNSPKKSRKP
ncbi:MAG: transcriptional regulator [Brevibacillus sp.]|nr:transcriptional regulator [Brevibacillus sp.]